MSQADLIYPGDLINYQVGPRWEDDDGFVYPPEDPQDAQFWAVHARPTTGDIAEWTWVADFDTELNAREYAAWQAKRS